MTIAANLETEWRELLRRLAALLALRGDRALDAVRLDATHDARLNSNVQPQSLAVVGHFDRVLASGDAVTAPICSVLDRLKNELRWRQNASYAGADFLDGYGYCELVGPSGHLRHPDVALGVLLLGPHVTYPEHAHPAAETYAVIAGRARWRQGDGVWRVREPGERIDHASMEPHAMSTADEPLLAAYVWHDHLHEGARLLVDARH